MRILLIEDEEAMAQVIIWGLEQERFSIDWEKDGISGLKSARENDYTLIILDWMLPGMDGLQVCAELRRRGSRTPILMLTARSTTSDRVVGLNTGADDYLPKPFDFNELLARIRALLRRDMVNRNTLIRIEDLEIDTVARTVTRGGVDIPLSRREFELLCALAMHEGRVLTREVIQERIWVDTDAFSNTVDVKIVLLRKKIDAGRARPLIQTVRGLGYRLKRHTEDELE
jgi:DNA-binding response OmpR family regulator